MQSPAGMCTRRRSHFLLRGQKRVTKEKATPTVCVPALSRWETCGARFGRGLAKLACGSNNASPDPPKAVLLGAYRGGPRDAGSVARSATSRPGREPGEAGLGLAVRLLAPTPCGVGE